MTYLSSFIFGISAFGQNTVSVPFNNGFVGDVSGNNTSLNSYYLNGLQGLGWSNISFSQESSSGIFTMQGNDIVGYVKITDYSGVVHEINGFITWRTPSGNDPHTMVFRPTVNNIVLNTNGFNGNSTYLIDENKYIGLTRNGSSLNFTAPGSVSGNSATNGLLDALNNILFSLPTLTITGDIIHFTATSAKIGVNLSDPSQDLVTATLTTLDGTAYHGTHYDSVSQTIAINPGQTYFELIIPVSVNYTPQQEYYFEVHLSNSMNASIVKSMDAVTILTDLNALPVVFLGMQYRCTENKEPTLYWQTASELNAHFFEVLFSNDGQTWDIVGEIAANGTTSRTSSYSFTPSLPYTNSTSYFRLKQCDYDGDCELLPTVSVNCESNEKHIKVYPNPSNGDFVIAFLSNEQLKTNINLFNDKGQLVDKKEVLLKKGMNEFSWTNINLPNGIYLIKVMDDRAVHF